VARHPGPRRWRGPSPGRGRTSSIDRGCVIGRS